MTRLSAAGAIVRPCLFLVALAVSSLAGENAGPHSVIQIGGNVQAPRDVTWQDLQKLPQTSVQVTFLTDRGPETGSYSGALLWTVLSTTLFANDSRKNAKLKHAILVTGRDGYAVALSVGEIDPDFENKAVILAVSKDGKEIGTPGEIRLIVPGDRHGGRAVRDVVSIQVE